MSRILDTLPSLLHSLDDSYALARGVGRWKVREGREGQQEAEGGRGEEGTHQQ